MAETPDAQSPETPAPRRRTRRVKLLIVLAAVALGLLGAEAAYRGKLYLQIGQTPLGDAVTYHAWNLSTTRFDRVAGYSHMPGQQAVGVRVTDGLAVLALERTTNGSGNVGPPEDGYQDAAFKVLVVGDSFTESQREGTTWPALLQEELTGRLKQTTAVLNLARSGHGVLQMIDVAAAAVRERRPDLVAVAFITDDLNRARFWQEIREIAKEPRLVTRLDPGRSAADWPALGEFYEPRIDAAWCRRVAKTGGAGDALLEELNHRFDVRKQDNPRRINYAVLTSSFLYNRLAYGDPFFGIAGAAATPRFAWRDFHQDAAMVRAVGELRSLGATIVLVHLPQYEELAAGAYRMSGQQRSLRASLENLVGVPVVDVLAGGPLPVRPKSLFLLPHDHHPSRKGLGWFARRVAAALADNATTTEPEKKLDRRRSDNNTEGATDGRPGTAEAAGGR